MRQVTSWRGEAPFVALAVLWGCGAAQAPTPELPAEIRALHAVEADLRAGPVVRIQARLRAAADEGLEPAYELEADLWVDGENRASLEIRGEYLDQDIDVSLLCDGSTLRVGRRARPAAPDLAEGLLVALFRTGLLDIFEDLYRGEVPAAAAGRSVVEGTLAVSEALAPSRRAALEVDGAVGPPDHAYVVEGGRRSPSHVLLYESSEGTAPALRVETLGGFDGDPARFEHYEITVSDAAPAWVFSGAR